MRLPFAVLALLAALAAVPPAGAQALYRVELLVFRHPDGPALAEEHWPENWSLPDFDGARAFDDPGLAALGVTRLDPDQGTLVEAAARLAEAGHTVLLHRLWRQPALGRDETPRLRLTAGPRWWRSADLPFAADGDMPILEGRLFLPPDPLLPATQPLRPVPYTPLPAGVGPDPQAVVNAFDGVLRLERRRFLHVYLDALLRVPVRVVQTPQPAAATAVPSPSADPGPTAAPRWRLEPATGPDELDGGLLGVRIQAHRRLRSGELHYLDHPFLGVLILVEAENG
ncbi:MAG: hypothetical protein KatS3mg121_1276 [Gammaproteobacteria bacterium]|nr:MAG: hypothetical protein KatS3mg121_1276 [Gammaproteobacteria bacterium]